MTLIMVPFMLAWNMYGNFMIRQDYFRDVVLEKKHTSTISDYDHRPIIIDDDDFGENKTIIPVIIDGNNTDNVT